MRRIALPALLGRLYHIEFTSSVHAVLPREPYPQRICDEMPPEISQFLTNI